jgi:hypothetical protein
MFQTDPRPARPPLNARPIAGTIAAMKKPASITVLGILNLAFAGAGILSGCYGLISPVLIKQTNPAMAEVYTGTFLIVSVVLAVIGTGSKTLMGISGYGLIKGQAWGRKLGRVWAVFSIVFGLSLVVLNIAYILPVTIDAVEKDMQRQMHAQGQQAMNANMMQMVKAISYVSAIGGGLVMATAYQITFLIMMNRKPVNDYFARRDANPADGD